MTFGAASRFLSATVVIGGILVDTESVGVRQLPGPGNLPRIGPLFKKTNTAESTSALRSFIATRIQPLDTIKVLAPSGTNSSNEPQRR